MPRRTPEDVVEIACFYMRGDQQKWGARIVANHIRGAIDLPIDTFETTEMRRARKGRAWEGIGPLIADLCAASVPASIIPGRTSIERELWAVQSFLGTVAAMLTVPQDERHSLFAGRYRRYVVAIAFANVWERKIQAGEKRRPTRSEVREELHRALEIRVKSGGESDFTVTEIRAVLKPHALPRYDSDLFSSCNGK